MARMAVRISLVGVILLAAAAPMTAHHSVSAEFDTAKPITLTGTIKQIEWTNPHIYTHVETKDADGKLVVYRVEGAAPNGLFRQGWRKDSLKQGEVVTVSGIRAKSPTSMNIGQATITTADGRKIFGVGAAGGRAPGPAQ